MAKKKYGGTYTFRKYSTKHDYIKALHNKTRELWKEVAYKMYGKFCYVEKYYPHIRIKHTNIIQVDHCISRGDKNFFYDLENALPICSACNQAKHYKQKGVHEAVTEMVKKRNPDWYKGAIWKHQAGQPNINFSQTWWLEEKIGFFRQELSKLEAF